MLLAVSGIFPTTCNRRLRTFQWRNFAYIFILAAAASFWYILLPKKPAADILLLVFMAAVWIAGLFKLWYVCPYPKLYLPVLGQLMWFRTGLFAMLCIRRVRGVGFGFWPSPREWKIGVPFISRSSLPFRRQSHSAHRIRRLPAARTNWEKTSLLAIGTFFGDPAGSGARRGILFPRPLVQQCADGLDAQRMGRALIGASLLIRRASTSSIAPSRTGDSWRWPLWPESVMAWPSAAPAASAPRW